MPPPPEDESIKPMTVVGACMWATGSEIVLLWLITTTRVLKGTDGYDMIGALLCQVAAYLFILYLILRVHAPNTPIRGLLALRGTNPWFFLLGPVLGLSAAYPSYGLLMLIHRFFPPEEELYAWTDVFYDMTQPERVLIAVGLAVTGPFVEEMLFRGAIYRPMRIDKRPVVVIVVTAILFSAVHLDLQKLVPLFLMGLMLGYLRWASGSLVPPLLLHMAYNGVATVQLFSYDTRAAFENAPLPISFVAGGGGALALALLFTHALAKSSRRASAARRDDT